VADTIILPEVGESPPPHPRGVSYRKPIDAAKEAVSVLELAERLASEQGKKLMGHGDERFTSCLLPGHDDRSPSFYANVKKNAWFCHSCQIGGDVVRLAQLAWGYPVEESHVAAAELLWRFGHDLPKRPPAWFRKQERQKPIRNAIAQARFEHLRRRLFRALFAPALSRTRTRRNGRRRLVCSGRPPSLWPS
jgi:DNA primase